MIETMNKEKIEESKMMKYSSLTFKSYSVEEIWAAGGTTAFANKLGKNPELIGEKFKDLPEGAFLTEDDVIQALKTLKESK